MNAERSIEVTGEDVEQAIEKGLAELGVGPGEVIVEVLEEPSRGMFGLGSRPARVRLQLLMGRAAPPAADDSVPESAVTADDIDDDSAVVDDDIEADIEADDAEPSDDIEVSESESFDEQPIVLEAFDGPLDEDAEVGKVVLAELLEKMSVRAEVVVRREPPDDGEEDAPWLLDVAGTGDLNVLIGRRGETLASLQYITRLITSRELQRRANIVVDVEGYKSRRTSKLHDLARRMADQAAQDNRTITLEPMPPYERRIVHLALREREDVYTESVGDGQSRKVTIIPR